MPRTYNKVARNREILTPLEKAKKSNPAHSNSGSSPFGAIEWHWPFLPLGCVCKWDLHERLGLKGWYYWTLKFMASNCRVTHERVEQ